MGSTTVPTTSRFYESFAYDILFHHFLRSLSSIHNSARSFVRGRDQGYPKMQQYVCISGLVDVLAAQYTVHSTPILLVKSSRSN